MVKLMKTPTSKSVPNIKINVKSKRGASITTPEKGKISRHYQMLGGEKVRGAAAASARAFSLSTTKGSADVKKYDREICDGFDSHANRRSTGRPKKINPEIEAEIIVAWDDDDTPDIPRSGERFRPTTVHIAQMGGTKRIASHKRSRPKDWRNQEGKRGSGAKRVHKDAPYGPLRARLGIV